MPLAGSVYSLGYLVTSDALRSQLTWPSWPCLVLNTGAIPLKITHSANFRWNKIIYCLFTTPHSKCTVQFLRRIIAKHWRMENWQLLAKYIELLLDHENNTQQRQNFRAFLLKNVHDNLKRQDSFCNTSQANNRKVRARGQNNHFTLSISLFLLLSAVVFSSYPGTLKAICFHLESLTYNMLRGPLGVWRTILHKWMRVKVIPHWPIWLGSKVANESWSP